MSKVIKYETDLDWFDIRPHLNLEHKSPSWWRQELASRKIKLELGIDKETFIKQRRQETNDRSEKHAYSSRIDELFYEQLLDLLSGKPCFAMAAQRPVNRLLLSDAIQLTKRINDQKHKEELYTREHELLSKDPHSTLSIFNKDHSSFIKIDHRYTDAALLDAFKAHLKTVRKHSNIETFATTKVSHRKVCKLSEYMVLAILDMWIWEKQNDIRIKKSAMAAKLFNGSKGERELTDSIFPFVRQACSLPFLEELSLLD